VSRHTAILVSSVILLALLAGCSGPQAPGRVRPTIRFHLDRVIGAHGAGAGQFNRPTTLVADATGNLFVVDSINTRIQQFDATGVHQLSFGRYGNDPGEFRSPYGIATDGTSLYVTDRGRWRVEQFSLAGSFIAEFGSQWPEGGSLREPSYIAASSSVIAVADSLQRDIVLYSPTGTLTGTIGSLGAGDGQFLEVTGLAIIGSTLYAADRARNDIQAFALPAGTYSGKIGGGGSAAGWLRSPTGIAAAATATALFVLDNGNGRVQLLTLAGPAQGIVHPDRTTAGALASPAGIATWNGGFVVADTGHDRLVSFLPDATP